MFWASSQHHKARCSPITKIHEHVPDELSSLAISAFKILPIPAQAVEKGTSEQLNTTLTSKSSIALTVAPTDELDAPKLGVLLQNAWPNTSGASPGGTDSRIALPPQRSSSRPPMAPNSIPKSAGDGTG